MTKFAEIKQLMPRTRIRWNQTIPLMIMIVMVSVGTTQAQQRFSGYGGMGVIYYKADGLSNYLNYVAPGSVLPKSFTSAIRFFFGGEYAVSKDWAIGIDYGYITKSVSGGNSIGSQQVNMAYSLPSLAIRRIFRAEGYSIRLGGEFGYHFGSVSASSPYSSQTQDYSASGFGVKLNGSVDTQLDKRLYARIGVEGDAEFIGDLKARDGSKLTYLDYNSGKLIPVNMDLLGVGLSFGLVYYF